MPENIPLAVTVLIWLLSGVIVFGWLLMDHGVAGAVVFALVFFGLPVLVYKRVKKK